MLTTGKLQMGASLDSLDLQESLYIQVFQQTHMLFSGKMLPLIGMFLNFLFLNRENNTSSLHVYYFNVIYTFKKWENCTLSNILRIFLRSFNVVLKVEFQKYYISLYAFIFHCMYTFVQSGNCTLFQYFKIFFTIF